MFIGYCKQKIVMFRERDIERERERERYIEREI